MSKAFTKEDDSEPERVTRMRSTSGLPPGALNYMTADGARRMKAKVAEIRDTEPERAADIQRILDSATIVPQTCLKRSCLAQRWKCAMRKGIHEPSESLGWMKSNRIRAM
jgi:hypothetical protein